MSALAKKQPLGVYSLPTGFLLLPATPGGDEAIEHLSHHVTPEMPAEYAFYQAALEENIDGALAHLTGDDQISQYNRAVLAGDDAQWHALLAADITDSNLSAMVRVCAFSLGFIDDLPDPHKYQGEFAAMVASAKASQFLEENSLPGALAILEWGAEAARESSPILSATLLANRAELQHQSGLHKEAVASATEGLERTPATADESLIADLKLVRALARQMVHPRTKDSLKQIVADYHAALGYYRAERDPQKYAMGNQQLALAYLETPMSSSSDQLRYGIAVNCLREALKVYTREANPDMWASTQSNLANALVYLPSAKQGDNIVEAVELLEEVLTYRTADRDPVGRARALANQATALGHLDIRNHSREKYTEAHALFTASGYLDEAKVIEDQLVLLDQEA